MEITTKYNVGDLVLFVKSFKYSTNDYNGFPSLCVGKIDKVMVQTYGEEISITYLTDEHDHHVNQRDIIGRVLDEKCDRIIKQIFSIISGVDNATR